MYCKAIVLSVLVSISTAKDLKLGPDKGGILIFDNLEEATPALWTRSDIVAVRAEDNEVIQRVKVTDYHEKKLGVVEVLEGGVGKNIVVLGLKSPGVLRGYQFHVEVYAVNKTHYDESEDEDLQKQRVKRDKGTKNLLRFGKFDRKKRSAQYDEYASYEDDYSEEVSDDTIPKLKPVPKAPIVPEVPKSIPEIPKIAPEIPAVPESPKEVEEVQTEAEPDLRIRTNSNDVTTETIEDISTTQAVKTNL